MFDQLPVWVQISVIRDFLYPEFLGSFHRLFAFPNKEIRRQHTHYTWHDEDYRAMMRQLLVNLEPRREEKDVILREEGEEWSEVIFFTKGEQAIGFELNRIKQFVLKVKGANMVGAYGCTFDKRSYFVVKTRMVSEGYSIRKLHWKELLEDFPHITHML